MAEDHGQGLIGRVSELQHQLEVQPLQVSYASEGTVRGRRGTWEEDVCLGRCG